MFNAIRRERPLMTVVGSADPHVSVCDVQKIYSSTRGPVQALKNISLDIKKGEFVSILGPSGCGKSTLLKCIAGLEKTSSGVLTVSGRQLAGPPNDTGMVFQRDVLLDWRTIHKNVLITAEFLNRNTPEMRSRASALLERFGLAGYEDRHPWELSGGMRQRASICRALLCDPNLLLMDEPFGALDAMTRDDLNLELARIWQETRKTVIFITHGISEAVFLSDRVVIMDRNPGRIVETLDIDLPRPRSLAVRESAAFSAYTTHIRKVFASLGIIKEG